MAPEAAPVDAKRFVFTIDVDPAEASSELYNYDESTVPWILVLGGGLEVSVYFQLGWSADLRLIMTRMTLGTGPVEITSQTLRSIPIASILAQFVKDFDAAGELSWPDGWDPAAPGSGREPDWEKWFVHRMLRQRLPTHWQESRGGRRTGIGGDPAGLEHFADVYLGYLATNPHNAMTATARELNISRATANRRADECRRRGLLPPTVRARR